MNENDKIKVYGFGKLDFSSFYIFLDGESGTVLQINDHNNTVFLHVEGRGKVMVHGRQCELDSKFKNVVRLLKKEASIFWKLFFAYVAIKVIIGIAFILKILFFYM